MLAQPNHGRTEEEAPGGRGAEAAVDYVVFAFFAFRSVCCWEMHTLRESPQRRVQGMGAGCCRSSTWGHIGPGRPINAQQYLSLNLKDSRLILVCCGRVLTLQAPGTAVSKRVF